MAIQVEGDLRADARAHFRSQLTAMGFDVESEVARARAVGAARAENESNAELKAVRGRFDETRWLCMSYLNAVRRRIVPRARPVERAPGLAENPLAQPFMDTIDDIEKASRRGEDLCSRLSGAIDHIDYNDSLLNDWAIHHLHLGTLEGRYARRTAALLFAFVTADRIYFLDVLLHGRGKRPWIRRELVEIIHRHWPDSIKRHRINGVTAAKLSDREVAIARHNNLTMFIEVSDSTVYAPLGGGYMSSGISKQVLTSTDWLCSTIDGFSKWSLQNAEAIRDGIFRQRGIHLTNIHVGLAFNERGFTLIETQTRSGLRTAP